ncbi:DUF305 domain-containing protein [Rhodococcus opacus]|nr:DUF305 domain-containing protein [Rhodococcus opacus]
MTNKSLAVGVAAVAALVALTACSNSGNEQASQSGTSASVTATTAGTADTHNQADVTFAQQMIPHHAQAIEMSDVVLAKDGIDPRVTDLATQIKAAQGPEIEQLQGWLSEWGQPGMPMSTPGMMTPGQSMPMSTPGMMTPGHAMPMQSSQIPMSGGMSGMMSDQDMEALRNAQGVEASRLYLTQMTTHHQGAITMAQTEIDSGQYPDAVAMAHTIADTQQQEITTMQNILSSL